MTDTELIARLYWAREERKQATVQWHTNYGNGELKRYSQAHKRFNDALRAILKRGKEIEDER